MIEAHLQPDKAWSDAEQQITPKELSQMLDSLVWRKETQQHLLQEDISFAKLRDQLDQLDEDLIQLLSNRMKLSDEIGTLKKNQNITILQTDRWDQTLKKALQKAESLGLSEEFIIKYFETVHMESINHQNKVMNQQ
jgi:chorismate mutase